MKKHKVKNRNGNATWKTRTVVAWLGGYQPSAWHAVGCCARVFILRGMPMTAKFFNESPLGLFSFAACANTVS